MLNTNSLATFTFSWILYMFWVKKVKINARGRVGIKKLRFLFFFYCKCTFFSLQQNDPDLSSKSRWIPITATIYIVRFENVCPIQNNMKKMHHMQIYSSNILQIYCTHIRYSFYVFQLLFRYRKRLILS